MGSVTDVLPSLIAGKKKGLPEVENLEIHKSRRVTCSFSVSPFPSRIYVLQFYGPTEIQYLFTKKISPFSSLLNQKFYSPYSQVHDRQFRNVSVETKEAA